MTPKGLLEKSLLTYDYMAYSLGVYRRTRETLRETLSHLPGGGAKRMVLYGVGEAAELAYVTLKELGLEPVGFYAREAGGDFLGFPVRAIGEVRSDLVDGVVVATFDRPEPHLADLRALGIPPQKLLTLRRPFSQNRSANISSPNSPKHSRCNSA